MVGEKNDRTESTLIARIIASKKILVPLDPHIVARLQVLQTELGLKNVGEAIEAAVMAVEIRL